MDIKKAKITDVAKYAGVSVSTVSLVLSGKGRISDATITKVNHAIEALNYVRNTAAANLRSHQSNLIGLVVRDITDPFYMGITSGISDQLERQGYMLFLAQSGNSKEKQLQCIQSMIQQGVAGIILSPVREAINASLDLIHQANIPVISIARSETGADIDYVGPDNTLAAKMATEHLIAQGHRHIAYVGGGGESLTRAERIGGYCSTLMQYGLPFKNDWIVECSLSQASAVEVTHQLLNKHPKITAILCHRPATAIGALYGAQLAGKSIGQDNYIGQQVALLGFDNAPETELTRPALSMIHTPTEEIGYQTAKLMARKLTTPLAPRQSIHIKPSLLLRGSA
ncbi:Mal regulon transcriptional regulator MalI [Vibrio sp. S11_S32]|uniref:Mal regulon transcriptional regulator MalI n=1 Tax=Vibrio sp. S11_S32 TaxID=2720225 RepID=UPI001681BFAB|nr:Mal regulon transcriptional regulator MalI [Vibrio sp. S11_S32]MBD1575819.1 Mal regulon transcriptional regulator MalI [Vibrio sp. S11_S32]